MNYNVETEFDRALDPGTRKRVIGNRDDILLARNFRDRFEIDQFEEWIARRLDPHHARVRFDLTFEPAGIGQIDIGEIEIGGATPHLSDKTKCAAVKIVAHDNMGADIERIESGCRCGES